MALNDTDKIILTELLRDGRQSSAEIARKHGLHRQRVHNRMGALVKKGVIKKFTAVLDPSHFLKEVGHSPHAWIKAYILIQTKEAQFRKLILKKLLAFPEVMQVHSLLGRFDVILETFFKDKDALTHFLQRLQELSLESKVDVRTETLVVYNMFKEDQSYPFLAFLKTRE